MLNNMSLSRKIQLSLTTIAVILFTATLTFFYQDEKGLAEQLIKQNLKSVAGNYFDSVNTMMLTGTIANRQIIQQKIISQEEIIEARIIRAPALTSTLGEGFDDQKPRNAFENKGINGQQGFEINEQNGRRTMSFIQPIIARENDRGTNCLACHQVQENDVLGAVKITYDLSLVDKEITRSMTHAGIMQLILTVLGFGLLGLLLRVLIFKRLKRLRNTINDVEKNLDLNKEIKIHHHDELGAVSDALNKMMKKFKSGFVSVSSVSTRLTDSAQNVDEISRLTREAVLNLKNGTDSVAAAINELDASANEVKNNTKMAAQKSEVANESASKGLSLVSLAKEGISQLRNQVQENTHMISELSNKTHEVGSVLEVITGIAEQTNLLALNAAIEAARAGEQGRGFAVVADEVRSLATRTRESIDQIQDTIGGLQVDASNAVSSMNKVTADAQEKVEDVERVALLLNEITTEIKELDNLNSQIAFSAEQQNEAAAEINVNVVNISDVAEKSSSDAGRGKEISENLLELAYELNKQLSTFKL